jgi:hypothetical protein
VQGGSNGSGGVIPELTPELRQVAGISHGPFFSFSETGGGAAKSVAGTAGEAARVTAVLAEVLALGGAL